MRTVLFLTIRRGALLSGDRTFSRISANESGTYSMAVTAHFLTIRQAKRAPF